MLRLSEHDSAVLHFISRFPSSADAQQLAAKQLKGEARRIARAIIRRNGKQAK